MPGLTGGDRGSTSCEWSGSAHLCRRRPALHLFLRSVSRRIFWRHFQLFDRPIPRLVLRCVLHLVLPERQLRMRFFSGLLFVQRLFWSQHSSACSVLRLFHPSAWPRSSETRELLRFSRPSSWLSIFRHHR